LHQAMAYIQNKKGRWIWPIFIPEKLNQKPCLSSRNQLSNIWYVALCIGVLHTAHATQIQKMEHKQMVTTWKQEEERRRGGEKRNQKKEVASAATSHLCSCRGLIWQRDTRPPARKGLSKLHFSIIEKEVQHTLTSCRPEQLPWSDSARLS